MRNTTEGLQFRPLSLLSTANYWHVWSNLTAQPFQQSGHLLCFGVIDPLHATIEEFAADGYTHIKCYCPRCRIIRLRPISYLPRISLGLTIAQLSARLHCFECGGQVHSVKPWRLEDVLGKLLGQRG